MKILLINKFLHPNGGSETYIFRLGDCLRAMGHEVQYFGMEHEGRMVGNRVDSYTSDMDFHGGGWLSKLTYPVKTVYSSEARKKLRAVLNDFAPDVCHLNNFNYQLTPSVISEIVGWRKKTGKACRILYTAHDYQLVCPNHMCHDPSTHENCEKCLGGHYFNCFRGRCIHGSSAKSLVGTAEAVFWKLHNVYRHIDRIVCCSHFMKSKMDTDPRFADKTVVLHNFVEKAAPRAAEKKDYVLYFGRYAREKGIGTLIEAARALPEIPFVFAGSGPLEDTVGGVPNIKNVGFRSGEALETLIREARFTVYPSEWYENCPFSVMESRTYGTPVIGADIGGIPELIDAGVNGELFESGNAEALTGTIAALWHDRERLAAYTEACADVPFDTAETYTEKLLGLYAE